MNKYSRFYISGQEHDNAVSLVSVDAPSITVQNNTSISRPTIPLTRMSEVLVVPDSGYVSVAFYPFLITNVYKNNSPFYFKHSISRMEYPESAHIETDKGNEVDPSYYFIENVTFYHNLVNVGKRRYYFVNYPERTGLDTINFAKRELLRTDLVMFEVAEQRFAGENRYYVEVTDSDIKLYTKPGTYYISYSSSQLLHFQLDYDVSQSWWAAIQRFAYKNPASGKVFTNTPNYEKEDFYPVKGTNYIIDRGLEVDDNDILFATSFPIRMGPFEFPIVDLDTGLDLPIRSIDHNTGAIEINRDDLAEDDVDKKVFNIGYFIKQKATILDITALTFPIRTYFDFNPVTNKSILNKYVMVYCHPYDKTGERIHQASFELDYKEGKHGFYLRSIVPYDPYLAAYVQPGSMPITLDIFKENFDVVYNPGGNKSVLILGLILTHDKMPSTKIYSLATDVRKRGGGLKLDKLSSAMTLYPEVRYNWELQPLEGDVVPAMCSFLMYVPSSVLTSFGIDDIKNRIAEHATAAHHAMIMTVEDGKFVRYEE